MQIARMNAMLTATAEGFAGVFSKAGNEVKGFASTVAGVAGGMAAYDFAKGVAESAYHATVGLVEQQMEAIDTNAKLADRLGFTTEQFMGLAHGAGLAGVSTEQLTGGVEKMLKAIGDTNSGLMTRDPFTLIGLSAKRLASENPDQAFKDVADALSHIPNVAQRASAETQIFGKAGQQLGPLLASGAEGIKAAQEEAIKLGFAFTRVDAAKVEAANDSLTRMHHVIEGVGNQIAIGLAPYIDAVATKMVQFATEGEGVGPVVSGALKTVIVAMAKSADFLGYFQGAWYGLEGAAVGAIDGILIVVDYMYKGVANIVELLTGTHLDTTFIDEFAENVHKKEMELFGQAGEKFSGAWNNKYANAAEKSFADIEAASQSAAAKAAAAAQQAGGAWRDAADNGIDKAAKKIAELQKQVDQFELTKAQKAGADVLAAGGTEDQANQAEKLQTQLDLLDEKRKLVEKINKANEAALTPGEKYAAQIERINELKMKGIINDKLAQGAADVAADELKKAQEKDKTAVAEKTEGPKLLQAGSQEAAQFVASIARRQDAAGDQKQLVKGQLAGNKYLEQIAKNTQAVETPTTVTEFV